MFLVVASLYSEEEMFEEISPKKFYLEFHSVGFTLICQCGETTSTCFSRSRPVL